MDSNSLAHSKWNCKYHIVFAPKYRRQVIYGKFNVIQKDGAPPNFYLHRSTQTQEMRATQKLQMVLGISPPIARVELAILIYGKLINYQVIHIRQKILALVLIPSPKTLVHVLPMMTHILYSPHGALATIVTRISGFVLTKETTNGQNR